MMKHVYALMGLLALVMQSNAQLNSQAKSYTRADTLRGSLNEARNWWDVQHYAVDIEPDYQNKTIKGKVDIRFKVLKPGKTMQIDLQEPMQLSKASIGDKPMIFSRDGNAFYINASVQFPKDSMLTLTLQFQGNVTVAKRPPWDGGWIFSKDKLGRPWMSVACQGLGASVWLPCKDHQSDEPDSMLISITCPDPLLNISNGRLRSVVKQNDGYSQYNWFVANPINNYDVTFNIGNYVHFTDTYASPIKNQNLTLDYWVMKNNEVKAKKQFEQVKPMLAIFENRFISICSFLK